MSHVVAVDAGSGSCRAASFAEDGTLHALCAREWEHPAEPGVPGGRRFDTGRAWSLIRECIESVSAGVEVEAIATSSFRGGLVAFDTAGEVLWAVPNGDARAGAEARALIASGEAEALQARGGDWVSLGAAARLRWLRAHEPAIFDAAASFGLINDWLVRRLCGELVTDPSVGSASGLFSLAERTWSAESLALCELDAARLPRVAAAGTVAGATPAGTLVAVGGADTPLGLVGLGVWEPGRCVALGGTHWQQSLSSTEPLPAARLRTLCHALDGQWLTEGIGFHSGLALRWFRDAFCPGASYAELEREAATVAAGAEGVVAVLANAMDARAWRHAAPAFVGFDLERPAATGRAAFIRAILEAAAFVARAHVDALEALNGPIDGVLLAGGVARGAVWPQIVADVLGRPVAVSRRSEATVRGTALAAAVAAGRYLDLAAAAAAEGADIDRVLEPADPAYEELYPRWRRVYEALLPAAAELPPLWRAPGT
jgi:autoinducer 2 (AI-2) kinase